ncbi:F-box-like domain superfamily [Arabidopsis suecica]|uniref:F-box-like domain superfamily n=1 Tax=Arabidopsis suecica TaxID=45249 RepID=A0A8T1ZAE7_ARASU|nr:F-box-like domain superfamily [Arabidopsis suecica]
MEAKIERSICVEPLAGFSNAREDLISKLPDVLISQILSYLPTKDIVKTSVLSKRWKSIWLLIPGLDLDSCEFPDYYTFVDFMNDFLFSSREQESCLNKLKLSIQKNENDPSCVTLWTDVVARGKLTHLDVEFGGPVLMRVYCELMPLSLYTCKTLLHLRLYRVLLRNFDPRVGSLPLLKTMCLEENVYLNEASLESLISSCPVLEDLTIVRADDNEQMTHNFLMGISRVRYLIVSEDMMELIYSYLKVESSLPQFCNLSCLKASVWLSSFDFLDILPKLLESCPNLKSIVLDTTCIVDRTKETVERRVSSVPKCLLSSLEYVEIKNRISVDDGALEVARYFVENSVNLKKLVLGLASSFLRMRLAKRALLKDLLTLPRRSSMCQIEVFNALNGRALCYRKNKKTGRVGRIF